ncbi:Uma2 family endonuclease [Bernardetia sp.]|uniref:Uma2 family endonuclease n=1 Tax=Bernardetia sp. TaxID=1937974 RepID=UPI0025BFBD98|nr:Uma2 family endonuclease [Bernardetia sp.]
MSTTKKAKDTLPKIRKNKKNKTEFISEEEYLKNELIAETKSEYHAGEVVAMAGATLVHNQITSNLVRHIGNCLEYENCNVLGNDMLVYLEECKKYVYPDVVVICEEPEFTKKVKGRTEAITNPQIIIEVLSKGTAEYDMGEKMKCYLKLKSLNQYVIVSSERKLVITYTKDEKNEFKVKTYSENDDVLIGECEIPMEKIYHKIGF